MVIDIDLQALKEALIPYLDSLKSFNFSYLNPLFWVFIFVLFLILLRFWQAKKSFSFCLITSIILLASTKLEGFLANKLTTSIETFDPLLIRIISCFIIVIIGLYYAVMKGE